VIYLVESVIRLSNNRAVSDKSGIVLLAVTSSAGRFDLRLDLVAYDLMRTGPSESQAEILAFFHLSHNH